MTETKLAVLINMAFRDMLFEIRDKGKHPDNVLAGLMIYPFFEMGEVKLEALKKNNAFKTIFKNLKGE